MEKHICKMSCLGKEARAYRNAVTAPTPTLQALHGKYLNFDESGHFKSCLVWVQGIAALGMCKAYHKIY